MKITAIDTYLMHAGRPTPFGGWGKRNWLFVKVHTDEGIYGVGEASGWPRVVETAIHDLAPIVVGEDPFHIEKIWQKMLLGTMGHGMTGIVGSGAMTGIEMALRISALPSPSMSPTARDRRLKVASSSTSGRQSMHRAPGRVLV